MTNKHKGFAVPKLVFVILGILIIGGIGLYVFYNTYLSTTLNYRTSPNTSATITRSNPLKQPGVSDFTKTVRGTLASSILDDIDALKAQSVNINNTDECTADDGVQYFFKFSHPTVTVTADPSGCQTVTINNGVYTPTNKFWADVSKATGQAI